MRRPASQEPDAGYLAGTTAGARIAAAFATQPARADAALRSSSQPLCSSMSGSINRSREVQLGRRSAPAEVEQMVTMLDQRATHATEADASKLRMLADQVQRLMEGLQAMRVAREIHDERREKECRMIENSLQLDLQGARQARKEMESRAEDLSSSRVSDLAEELRRGHLADQTVRDDYTREIGEELRRLTAIFEDQRNSRKEYGERISTSLEGEFQKVQEAIGEEERRRYEAQGTMLRMVEDMCSGMRGEIQQERTEREAVQNKLLGLLEDTCNRIESSFCSGAGAPFSFNLPMMSIGGRH